MVDLVATSIYSYLSRIGLMKNIVVAERYANDEYIKNKMLK